MAFTVHLPHGLTHDYDDDASFRFEKGSSLLVVQDGHGATRTYSQTGWLWLDEANGGGPIATG
ncbi:MAG: hypothetical protein M3P48_05680 [Actinomycetota bacterium]|nr:hypothetical protein [Actinomycetota bacterium]